MKTELTINPEEFGLEVSKAKEMTSGLSTTLAERDVLKQSFKDVTSLELKQENLSAFKELRLKIVKNRTQGLKAWHTANKAFYLAGGRFVDAIYNKEVLENEEMEKVLMNSEKYFENLEIERLNNLRIERFEKIKQYTEIEPAGLAEMESEVFEAFESGLKAKHEAKIQAEKQAEEKRIAEAKAEAERIEAQRIENEKLKAEAEAREKEIAKERAKAEADRKKAEEAARKEREANEAKLKAEAEARQKVEKELEEKKQAEAKAKADRIAEEKKLAKAPVKQKLKAAIDLLNLDLPESEISEEIKEKFNGFKSWAKNKVESL